MITKIELNDYQDRAEWLLGCTLIPGYARLCKYMSFWSDAREHTCLYLILCVYSRSCVCIHGCGGMCKTTPRQEVSVLVHDLIHIRVSKHAWMHTCRSVCLYIYRRTSEWLPVQHTCIPTRKQLINARVCMSDLSPRPCLKTNLTSSHQSASMYAYAHVPFMCMNMCTFVQKHMYSHSNVQERFPKAYRWFECQFRLAALLGSASFWLVGRLLCRQLHGCVHVRLTQHW